METFLPFMLYPSVMSKTALLSYRTLSYENLTSPEVFQGRQLGLLRV